MFLVDEEVYKRIRILAIERNVDISVIIEEAMREKVQREYPDYRPPVSVLQQQQQRQQELQPQHQTVSESFEAKEPVEIKKKK